MYAHKKAKIAPDDALLLTENLQVHVECKKVEAPVPEGIFTAGGLIDARVYVPDVYYKTLHGGLRVLILIDYGLNGQLFILRLEDIISLEVELSDFSSD